MKASELQLHHFIGNEPTRETVAPDHACGRFSQSAALGELRRELTATLGWKTARGILTRYGYFYGVEVARNLGRLPWDDDGEWMRAGIKVMALEGNGSGEIKKLQIERNAGRCEGSGVWRDSFEAKEHLRFFGRSEIPACWMLSGFLSGFAGTLIGKEIWCVERTCLAQGGSECTWELLAADTLSEQVNQMRETYLGTDLHLNFELMTRNQRLATLSTFTSGLAHEFRNPLNSASIQLHVLERALRKHTKNHGKEISDQCLKVTNNVRDEIHRLSRLVEDFLLFARPYDLNLTSVGIIEIMNDVIESVWPAASKVEMSVEWNEQNSAPRVRVDPEKIKQAFMNLVTNAVEAMSEGGRLSVRINSDGNQVQIRFADNGPGIPDAIRPQIFDVFFSTKEMGTGLGLPIAYRIIEEHGGKLQLESSSASGTVFLATLPSWNG